MSLKYFLVGNVQGSLFLYGYIVFNGSSAFRLSLISAVMGCDGLLYIMFYLDQGDFTASKYRMQHLSFVTNLTDSEGR